MKINTPANVAKRLGTSERNIQLLIKKLGIKPERIGKTAILSEAHVKLIANRKKAPGPTARVK